ncbi:hypothetical protein QTG54_000822 [Skeletonema marinoi]|uniref:Uncharacterized protein n=1 Tax=Skeletonema marinoi TaxID=267567 RepID=A0AAD8YM26_9STRA|nr:hypothetical protein QTG54_000822 [Skeletonema marinoi]
MSALTMTSTAMSTSGRLTAGQRRRWHQQQQQMRWSSDKTTIEKSEVQPLDETKAVSNLRLKLPAITDENPAKCTHYHSNIHERTSASCSGATLIYVKFFMIRME